MKALLPKPEGGPESGAAPDAAYAGAAERGEHAESGRGSRGGGRRDRGKSRGE